MIVLILVFHLGLAFGANGPSSGLTVTEYAAFEELAQSSIPERRIEVTIPLNITTILTGPRKFYALAGMLQNSCDRYWKQIIQYQENAERHQVRTKRADSAVKEENTIPTDFEDDWGRMYYRRIQTEYQNVEAKRIRNLCKNFDMTLPEPYAKPLMKGLIERMKKHKLKSIFINIEVQSPTRIVFPTTNATTVPLRDAEPLPQYSHMRDYNYAIAILDDDERIYFAPTMDGQIPDLSEPPWNRQVGILCKRKPRRGEVIKTSKHQNGATYILMPGKYGPEEAQSQCEYAGFRLPIADTNQDRDQINQFAKVNNLAIVYIFSRHKGGDVYSLGIQTDVHLTPAQLEHFDERRTFVYNVDLASVELWNQYRYPWKLMCYRDMTGNRLFPKHRIARRNDVTPRPNQIVLADTIPAQYLDELATTINRCYQTVDSLELNSVREIRNVLHRIRMQSIRISEGDRTTVLVYPLYQSPSTPDTLRPLRERRSVLSWLSQVYQIPIVRDLVDEIPTLVQKGAQWISDTLKPRVTYKPRESYVQITELNEEESQHTPLSPALRETTSTPTRRHEEAPHHYDLAAQQIHDEEVHRQLEQTQQNLHDLRAHTAAALEGLRQ